MWWRDRHIFHGRLLAAGHREGANDFDLFDAACYVIAELYRLAESTGFSYNHEAVEKLRKALKLGQARPEEAVAEAAAMRAEMEGAAGIAPQEPPEDDDSATSRTEKIDDAVTTLMEMREEMARGDSSGS